MSDASGPVSIAMSHDLDFYMQPCGPFASEAEAAEWAAKLNLPDESDALKKNVWWGAVGDSGRGLMVSRVGSGEVTPEHVESPEDAGWYVYLRIVHRTPCA